MPRPFEKGNKFGKGGARPGAGKKPNWFKERMAKIASREKSIKFIEDCIDGKNVDRYIGQFGQVKAVPPPANVRLTAWCEARDTGHGRPTQAVEHKGLEGIDFVALIRQAESERGLDPTV